MKRQQLLPEHIPGGENLTEESLKNINAILAELPKKTLLLTLLGIALHVAVGLLFKFIIAGALGYILLVIFLIFMPLTITILPSVASKKVNEELKKVFDENGIKPSAIKELLDNRDADKRAWGKPVSTVIRYRFICRKCKTMSPWKDFTLASCTEDTLADKIDELKKQALKKRKDFICKSVRVPYSLERKCDACGKEQPKHPPRWYSILLIPVVTFISGMILTGIASAISVDLTDAFGITAFIVTFLMLIFAIFRYVKRRGEHIIQFDFAGEMTDEPTLVRNRQFFRDNKKKIIKAAVIVGVLLVCFIAAAVVIDFIQDYRSNAITFIVSGADREITEDEYTQIVQQLSKRFEDYKKSTNSSMKSPVYTYENGQILCENHSSILTEHNADVFFASGRLTIADGKYEDILDDSYFDHVSWDAGEDPNMMPSWKLTISLNEDGIQKLKEALATSEDSQLTLKLDGESVWGLFFSSNMREFYFDGETIYFTGVSYFQYLTYLYPIEIPLLYTIQ